MKGIHFSQPPADAAFATGYDLQLKPGVAPPAAFPLACRKLVRRRAVGVVVDRLDATGLAEASHALAHQLQDPSLRQRCRDTAVSEISLGGVVLPRYRRLYDTLLGPRPDTKS